MSDLKTLADVLGDKLLNVADYQRPYAWEEKQLADLWADVDLLGELTHYTGTLVLQDLGDTAVTKSGQTLTKFDVVDGQQRLTTCVILLNRLVRALRGVKDEDAHEAAGELQALLSVNLDGVRMPRLQLGKDLRAFFRNTILGNEAPEDDQLQLGERRLLAAAQFFDAQIGALTQGTNEKEEARRLLELRARATYQLRFIVYSVNRIDEVGVLFETVNGRGKDLSELERVKNYLLYLSRQLNETQRDDITANINNSWSDIFSNLGRVRLRDDTLLRAHWLVTQDANTRNWHGADSVKAKFPRSAYVAGSSRLAGVREEIAGDDTEEDRLYTALATYVDSLRKSAKILALVHDTGATYDEYGAQGSAIRSRTGALRRSGSVATFYPLILAARLRHQRDYALYKRVIEYCERFSARVWAIRGLRSNAGESSIRWNARDLYIGKDPAEVLGALEARLWQLAPDDEVLSSFAPRVEWYPRSNAHKFLLYEYELALQRDASDIPEFGDMTAKGNKTTEHILPQTPEDDSMWWRDFTRDQHAQLVHGIGNLVLTRDNSRYGRRDYLDRLDGSRFGKRGATGRTEPWCYSNDANLARERELARQYPEWTPAAIEERANAIAEWAVRRWPAAPPSRPVPEDNDDRLVEDDLTDDPNFGFVE